MGVRTFIVTSPKNGRFLNGAPGDFLHLHLGSTVDSRLNSFLANPRILCNILGVRAGLAAPLTYSVALLARHRSRRP